MTDGDWIESKDQDPTGGVRLIQLADVGDGEFLDRSSRFLNDATASRLRCTFLKPGDVLVARMPDPLGRACVFPGVEMPAVTAVDVCIWRPGRHAADPRWLMHIINSPPVRGELSNLASGTTRQRVSGGNLKRFSLPVPPLAEQRRIVARIEALFARTRQARADLLRIAPLVEKSRAALLAAAFRGDLTEDVRHLTDADAAHGPWSIPASWSWRRVADVGRVGLGRQRSPVNHTGPYMRPYVRAANITWSGWDFSDLKEMNFAEPDFSRFRLVPGDVLLNEGSGSAREVGKPAIWRGEIADCCFQNTLLRVQPRECTAEYLYYYFLDAALSGRFADETQGVNIHHIGKEGLAAMPIPIPPRDEQAAIAQRLKDTLARFREAERDANRALALLDHLERSILTRAFRGDLVPQDPADEPAAATLASAQDGTPARPRRGRPRRAA